MRDSSMNTENQRHNMDARAVKRYHGQAAATTIGLDPEAYELLHEEASRSGWTMRSIAGAIIMDFFESGGSIDPPEQVMPKLRRPSK